MGQEMHWLKNTFLTRSPHWQSVISSPWSDSMRPPAEEKPYSLTSTLWPAHPLRLWGDNSAASVSPPLKIARVDGNSAWSALTLLGPACRAQIDPEQTAGLLTALLHRDSTATSRHDPWPFPRRQAPPIWCNFSLTWATGLCDATRSRENKYGCLFAGSERGPQTGAAI